MNEPNSNSESRTPVLEVDLPIYGLTAILKAAYRATGRAYLHLQANGEKVQVWMRSKDGGSSENLRGEFLNDLIDQRLRELVASETRAERELILAHALSRTGLLNTSSLTDSEAKP